MEIEIKELNFETVISVIKYCNKKLPHSGAAYFVVREICERIYRTYEGQGIPISLHNDINNLAWPMTRVLAEPNDINMLNFLVKQYGNIDFNSWAG